ncbi:acyl-CoA reductase-like NAD-dependent aldehyde dehydrogenase [Pseudomonas citronellolis]|uniref:aldehyde dehydrogenase n=1 Tax=Pseudomonas citronellolis TaxID=53408 RepID=UPI00209D1C04|nr:aldehyde dehydrogenase [Pseudomonas citronellolis]MCP1641536.1 acyl-CoA reductase-like NAD-dependent aldehyde dehydrogenase [Pseudomonas citronellolis]MCP1664454.1 acyl-CoA reductase-like NAD-dependent aldehyde dehydrogenase [Pseudomonas citronellolis]MCP1695428.1 acyl-CoA reductase-like NAD-dependent aldehyde dehydrogenase [Pseudomonas citronellolis]MCP1702289.1 acyl-CoA reductase-like NAD-dependent aldehyde dehydrogenase [Pseudomonas citronellolis]MCP1796175.1 acyl-CoA reductase-like NAD-
MTLARFQMCIDGQWLDALSGKTFESLDPSSAQPWALLPDAAEEDVERAVQAAQKAFDDPAWRKLSATARGKLLRRLGDLIAENREHLAQLESRDNGKLIRETRGQVGYLPEFFHYTAGLADKLEGGTLPIDKPDMFAYTVHEPLGVVAGIIPWNSPLYLTAIKLAPALAAGNTIVLKPSEHASATILELARLALEAGFPAGVVNVVTGFGPSTGAALTRHPLVRKIAFTGGAATARHVVRSSAENFAKLSLELGGKSPNIVFADADLDSAINGVVAGIYAATGQSCVAGSRLLVQREIYDEFVARLIARAQRIRIGNPQEDASEMGPMATAQQLAVVEGLVAAAKAEGARLLMGGKRPEGQGEGWYYEPTLFACDSHSMRIMQEEVFGPVASVIPFDDEAEALALANDSQYGLAAGIWTRDLGRAHRLARDVRSGIIWVNTYRAVSAMAPIGGFHQSGYGRESGIDSVLAYTELKTVWINLSQAPMPDPFVMR